MGACGEREDVQAARNKAAEWYSNTADYTKAKYNATKEYMGPKIAQAQQDYGPQLDKMKINYDIARMYSNGWVNETVVDESELACITAFERDLPLRNISLLEFERRLKKMVTPAQKDMTTVRVVEECFKDHWAFLDIDEEDSLTRELMFDETFLDEQEEHEEGEPLSERRVYVPWLMLMGLLYCRSNRAERAQKFYELVEIQLTESLARDDVELVAYIPIMFDICYNLMMRIYARHRNQDPEANQPQKDFKKYTPANYDVDEKIKQKLFQIWIEELFAKKSRLQRK